MLRNLAGGGLIVALCVAGLVSQSGRALAQYPPPQGSCVLATSATTVDAHASVSTSVTVLDVNGHPVSGIAVNLSIAHQPGSDATLNETSLATNATGVATARIAAGSTAGVVGLSAHTDAVSCAASIVVGEGAVLGAVRLPDTGGGIEQHDPPPALVASLLGVLGIAFAAEAYRRRVRRG